MQAELGGGRQAGARGARRAQEAVLRRAGALPDPTRWKALRGAPRCTAYARRAIDAAARPTPARDERRRRRGRAARRAAGGLRDRLRRRRRRGRGGAGLRRPASCWRATCCATTPALRASYADAVRARHGRRVPGHEPAPARARRPARRRTSAFVVGDELQSIYGFRHADVEVFRGRRAALGGARRDRDAADELPLAAGDPRGGERRVRAALRRRVHGAASRAGAGAVGRARPSSSCSPTRTAGTTCDLGGLPPAAGLAHAEARLLAQRVAELVESGAAAPEDVVVLLRAVGSLPVFERALQDVGLPTLAAGGRGYWGRQVVRDLCDWLAVLANPRDEVALLRRAGLAAGRGVDRRPGPASGDRPARQGHAWQAICGGVPHGRGRDLTRRLGPDDRERLRAFAVRFAAERARRAAPGARRAARARSSRPPATTCTCSSLPDGERRLANVHKLLRLAADYEARARPRRPRRSSTSRTPSWRRRRARPTRRSSSGTSDAVRLMTIHAAKGLEFGVVVRRRSRAPGARRHGRPARRRRPGRPAARRARRLQRAARSRTRRCASARMAAASAEEVADRVRRADARAGPPDRQRRRSPSRSGPTPTAQTAPPIAWLAPALVPGDRRRGPGGAGPRGRVDDAGGRGAARPRDGEHARSGRHRAAPPRARGRDRGPAGDPSPVLGDPGALGLAAAGPAADAVLQRAARAGRSAATASTSSACSACRGSPRRHCRRTSSCPCRPAASTS